MPRLKVFFFVLASGLKSEYWMLSGLSTELTHSIYLTCRLDILTQYLCRFLDTDWKYPEI